MVSRDGISRHNSPLDAIRGLVAVLAAGAFAGSMVVQRHWFPYLSKDNDEPVYRFQAELYRHGVATLPAAIGRTFRPWMSGPIGDRLIMVFPPGWPAVLAVGRTLTGSWRIPAAVAAALVVVAVFAFASELLQDRVAGLVAAAVVAVCPMLVVLTGTLLSYPFALALDATIATFALRTVRLRSPRQLLGGGLAAAALFSMRPIDAGILSLVCGAYVLWGLRREVQEQLRAGGWAVAGAAPVVLAVLAYNWHVTGAPLRFPLQAQGGDNRFGFGTRWITVDAPKFHVTPSMMWKVTRTLLGELPHWLPGGWLLLPLAVVGLVVVVRRDGGRPRAAALVALLVLYPAAHFFYWGTYFVTVGRQEYGPFYYLPMVLPLAVFAAAGITAVVRRQLALSGALVGVVAAVSLGMILPPKLAFAARHTASVKKEVALVDRLPKPATVIIPASVDGPWILHVRGYFANRRDLTGPTVFAAEDGAANVALFDRFPRRPVYELFGMTPPHRPDLPPRPRVVRLGRLRAPSLTIDSTFRNPTINGTVIAYVGTPLGLDRCEADADSTAGRAYAVRWTLTPSGATPDPASGCRPLPRAGLLDALNGHLLVGYTAAGTDDFDGVDRWERFYSMRSSPATGLEVVTPGLPRRVSAGDVDEPMALFSAPVHELLTVTLDDGTGRAPDPVERDL